MNNKKFELGFGFWLFAGGFAAVGLLIWAMSAFGGAELSAYGKAASREIALMCTTEAATQFHIHPELKIIISGVQQTIPADVGATATCLHSIHTHDATGIIHIESPVQKDFTLGDFFAVWGKEFGRNQILDYKADAAHKITMTVNGQAVDTFESTVMHDGDRIEIRYE